MGEDHLRSPRLAKPAICSLLALILGLHWGALQIVAWTGMVWDYAQSAPLTVALMKTFDDRHPCCLCRLIAKARKSERKSDQEALVGKLDAFCLPTQFPCFPGPRLFAGPMTSTN